jgi:dTDP-4-dehydrorhamnose 3,5-epimerase
MDRFACIETPIEALRVIERQVITDSRGFLSRLFCGEDLRTVGWHMPIVQINHTLTRQMGTVRGLHFQYPPHAEMKLVTCIRGQIWDVAVDLRAKSPTFLRWHAEVLSAVNLRALLIPEGFAHGFQSLTSDCEILYMHSDAYASGAEGGVNVRDTRVSINWPLPISEISAKDAKCPLLEPNFEGIIL